MDNTRRRRLGIDIEERRRQNRDAAARHRIRQQQRLDELEYKEVLLKQRLVELQLEVDALRRQREGLRPVIQDPFTATILDMISSADALRSGLLQTSRESSEIVLELRRLAEMIVGENSKSPQEPSETPPEHLLEEQQPPLDDQSDSQMPRPQD
ncbi:hypothetical protein LPJ72_005732 [Coemansia sp. Benny D160-2]|nr:hypothetical protein LPJ72_005732 [Coemansia sp. Benny D160-2]